MRREGSAFQGLGTVVLKELSDQMSSIRIFVIELLVAAIAFVALYRAIGRLADTTAEDPFLFLRIFTVDTPAATVVCRIARISDSAGCDRAGVRCGEQRA